MEAPMPKLNLDAIPQRNSTGYPQPYAADVAGRFVRRLSPVAGLTDFGASHVVLKPGAWSAQRHWHETEDELLVILSGEAVLVDDTGRAPMRPGDVAAFPKGDGNGHCLVNESAADCVFLVVGQTVNGSCHYPDIDLYTPGDAFLHKDGTPY
jgi:uncharacterized cupin superfamily protein